MLAIKHGVRLRGIDPVLVIGIIIVADVYTDRGATCTLTSVTDGAHMPNSLHNAGLAADFRLPDGELDGLGKEVRAGLGRDWDVLIEGDHMHIEYDPR